MIEFSATSVVLESGFEITSHPISSLVQLAQVEVGFRSCWVLHSQSEEPLGSFFVLFLVLSFSTDIEIHAGKVEHAFMVAFFGCLFVKCDSLIKVSLHTLTILIAYT